LDADFADFIFGHEGTKAQRFQNYLTAENTESAEVSVSLVFQANSAAKASFFHRASPCPQLHWGICNYWLSWPRKVIRVPACAGMTERGRGQASREGQGGRVHYKLGNYG